MISKERQEFLDSIDIPCGLRVDSDGDILTVDTCPFCGEFGVYMDCRPNGINFVRIECIGCHFIIEHDTPQNALRAWSFGK